MDTKSGMANATTSPLAFASLLAALFAAACGTEHETASYSPVDRSAQAWGYCGAPGHHAAVRDAVAFWAAQGTPLGPEVEGCRWPAIDIQDLTHLDRGRLLAQATHGPDGAVIALYRGWALADARERQATLRHEIGHVLGWGHGTGDYCLMSPEANGAQELCGAEQQALAEVVR